MTAQVLDHPSRHAVHFSQARSDWETPPAFFAELDREFHFTLDVCASADNSKCARYFTESQNALNRDWGYETCWMNPPYGRGTLPRWLARARDAAALGATVVCLVPARTDTGWWHDHAMKGEIRFIRGRLRFSGHKFNAPFPCAVVIFRPEVKV